MYEYELLSSTINVDVITELNKKGLEGWRGIHFQVDDNGWLRFIVLEREINCEL